MCAAKCGVSLSRMFGFAAIPGMTDSSQRYACHRSRGAVARRGLRSGAPPKGPRAARDAGGPADPRASASRDTEAGRRTRPGCRPDSEPQVRLLSDVPRAVFEACSARPPVDMTFAIHRCGPLRSPDRRNGRYGDRLQGPGDPQLGEPGLCSLGRRSGVYVWHPLISHSPATAGRSARDARDAPSVDRLAGSLNAPGATGDKFSRKVMKFLVLTRTGVAPRADASRCWPSRWRRIRARNAASLDRASITIDRLVPASIRPRESGDPVLFERKVSPQRSTRFAVRRRMFECSRTSGASACCAESCGSRECPRAGAQFSGSNRRRRAACGRSATARRMAGSRAPRPISAPTTSRIVAAGAGGAAEALAGGMWGRVSCDRRSADRLGEPSSAARCTSGGALPANVLAVASLFG